MISTCDCKSAFQDQRYGASKRLHTGENSTKGPKCTVCGKRKLELKRTTKKEDKK
jgi:hypothetical protein